MADDIKSVNDMEGKGRGGRTCCQRFKDAFSLVPPDVTPPNWHILWLVFISLFASAFTLTFLFPFLPEMVLTLGYSEEEKGTYVGLVASSVFAGRAVGSFFWGWLADLKGRRLVLLVTILFNGLFSFLFGFADSLPLAMVLRFLAGLVNGTVGVAKTVLYDVSDNTNQAFSMSILSIAWGLGLILGPTIGGYLALPATKYPSVFSPQGFFADYPFLLPSFCCFLVCGVVAVIMFFQFEEPALVLNTELRVSSHQHNCHAVDIAREDDDDNDDPKTASSGSTIPSSSSSSGQQPLLERRRFQSIASTPTSITAKTHMSVENLHCELELSHYYAAQLCSSQPERSSVMSRGDRSASKSMHNLIPAAVSLTDYNKGDDDLLPETRKRSYSHGHQTPQSGVVETDGKANMTNVKLNHVSPKGEGKAEETEIGVGDSESKVVSAKWDGREGGGGGGSGEGETGGGGVGGSRGSDVAVDLNERHRGESLETERSGSCWAFVLDSSLVHLIRQRDVRLSVALYTVMSFAIIGYEDVFTIFASTPKEYDGLGFSTDEIGIALGAVSIPLLFVQIKLYPILVSKFGIKRTYIITLFFIIVPIQLMPMVHLLVDDKVWLWVCLVLLTLTLRVAANSCFTGSSLLINNSVTSREAGKANGLGMTCTALARTLAPTIGGAMYSWTMRKRTLGPPVDVNLTFVFLGFVLFLSAVQCVFLPDHLDHQKK
ncbi:hypothetical protein ACOMHN_018121 [Nucella lapillus]